MIFQVEFLQNVYLNLLDKLFCSNGNFTDKNEVDKKKFTENIS